MSKREKIKSLKQKVKDLRAQVKKLKLKSADSKKINKPRSAPVKASHNPAMKPSMPSLSMAPKAEKPLGVPRDAKPEAARVVPPGVRHA